MKPIAEKDSDLAKLMDFDEHFQRYRKHLHEEIIAFVYSMDSTTVSNIFLPLNPDSKQDIAELKKEVKTSLDAMDRGEIIRLFIEEYSKACELYSSKNFVSDQDQPLFTFYFTLEKNLPNHSLLNDKLKICKEVQEVLHPAAKKNDDDKPSTKEEKENESTAKLAQIREIFEKPGNIKALATRRDTKEQTLLKALLSVLGVLSLVAAHKIPSLWETEGSKLAKKVKPLLDPKSMVPKM